MVTLSRYLIAVSFSLCVLSSMHAASAPTFNVSPSNVYLNAVVDGAAPASQVIVLNNTVAGSSLKWNASLSGSGATYCKLNPSEGTLVGQTAIELSVLASSVPAKGGDYECTVTFSGAESSPPATNNPSVSVSYGVYGKGVTLPPPNAIPPNPPQDLSVVATGLGTVSFNWYGSGDPADEYVAGYAVYRDGAKIAVTGLTSYQDSGLATGSYHTYTVTAFDSSLNTSAEAPPIAVTTFVPLPSGVPATYSSLYQGLQSNIATDYTLVNAQSTGAKYPVNYSVSLTSANENVGLRTIFTTLTVDPELDAAQALGLNTVMVSVGFPMFDPYFWEFQGQTASKAQQTVQNYLTFYELIAQDIHGRKDVNGKPMRMIIEANPLLTVDNPGGSLNPTAYYQSLSFETYEQRRAANTVTTAQYVQPDYLIVQSEPDTDARDDYRPELTTPATDVAMVQLIVNDLTAAKVPGLHTTVMLGAGMGAWQINWQEFLGTPGAGTGILGITGLDGIDNHVYYLTGQSTSGLDLELGTSEQMITSAHAAGKFASIAEFWPHKSLLLNESFLDVTTRDNFAFFAPIDQQFMPIMFELANQNSLEYLSAFNDGEFWAYLPYAALPCLPVYPAATSTQNQACDLTILNAVTATVATAFPLGLVTTTGTDYKALITEYWVAH